MKAIKYIKPLLLIVATVLLFGIYACNNDKPATEAKNADAGETVQKRKETGVIELTEQQMNAVGIELGSVEQKNLNAVVRASGQLDVPPQNKADVNVLMGGIITKINVLEGQAVHKGQVLAILENPDFIKMQQDYLMTKSSFIYTQQELQRQKELSEANAGIGKNLQQVQANYNTEKTKIATLEKQLQQLGINAASVENVNIISQVAITAPISGTVGHIIINMGTYVETTKPLMQIIDNSKIHCDLIVYEKDLFKVKVGQKVSFMLTNQNNQQIEGVIFGINKSFENESKGIIVHAVIEGAGKYNLIPGMYVTALIDIGNQLTSAVPVDAVVRSEGKDYIFIVDETQELTTNHAGEKKDTDATMHFKKVEVVTGVSELGYVQINIVDEMPEDAKVVAKGAFYILSKSQGSSEEE